ncbi:glycosyltransferase [Agrococcus jenensis]|uniref:Glycosyl transferase family 2 n=1 Tax=Agrococcus jenensis TaxID=46353 RepID=A0A3N2ATW9_9MICO|nr:glycosyltransferase [Agrococcus jenensis]ROR66473.1 glycosyl transferase family 2 [Agrococcus jenensis]
MAVVLICALDPDERLELLVEALAPRHVVVVDDGSGPDSAAVLARVRRRGATVLVHERNRGKGAALRTGIAHVRAAHPGADIVTADCDGQHRPQDVAAVEAAIVPGAIALGERRFTGAVPVRSRVGNTVARSLFALASGVRVGDAQTGLRGLPSDALPWIAAVPGDRFDHEQRVLLEASRRRVPLRGVPIATIYLAGNASSHFRPLIDSARVVAPLLAPIGRFLALGAVCFALDALLVVALSAVLGVAGIAAVLARAASGAVHFAAGRRWVFVAAGCVRAQARRYALLAAGTIAVGATALQLAVAAGAALLPAKVGIDLALAAATYLAQRFGVFAPVQDPTPTTEPHPRRLEHQ